MRRCVALKSYSPKFKVKITVGGQGSNPFSAITLNLLEQILSNFPKGKPLLEGMSHKRFVCPYSRSRSQSGIRDQNTPRQLFRKVQKQTP